MSRSARRSLAITKSFRSFVIEEEANDHPWIFFQIKLLRVKQQFTEETFRYDADTLKLKEKLDLVFLSIYVFMLLYFSYFS